MTPQPLAGVRVLDFCWMIAGPLTTRLLADLGAEVIKVESLARVDRIREVGVQPPAGGTTETNGVFYDCNANKKSLCLNLGHPAGIELAKRLAAESDVVTSNFTPDRMDRWGLGYDDLRAVREDIIVASMPVMGSEGPHSGWRAVGNGVVAMSGLNAHTGFPGRPPMGLGTLHSDFTTPYFAALQIAAAIHQRNETGKGQFIELAQYEATIHLLDTEVLETLANGTVAEPRGNRSPSQCPHGVFPCVGDDRWIAIAVRSDAEWLGMCEVLRLSELQRRSDLGTVEGRLAAVDEIEAAVAAATRTSDEWELSARLQQAGVSAAPVEDVGDLVGRDAPGVNYLQEIGHPFGHSMLLQPEPITWNDERLPVSRAPFMGEHSGDLLSSLLGLDQEELAQLAAEGVLS
jgi:benzylsuccinate CoA-transferase BbsF subunit